MVNQNALSLVKILEQHGFIANQDFMFVNINDETDFIYDGTPMYRITNTTDDTNTIYHEASKRHLTLNVINDFKMGKYHVGGQTSDNNSVYAVYAPQQGFVFTKNPKIKNLMETEYQFKNTHFGIPLSNGGKFRDEKKQAVWNTVLMHDATKQVAKSADTKQLDPNIIQAANNTMGK